MRWLVAWIVLIAALGRAEAHQSSVAYVQAKADRSGEVRMTIQVAIRDLGEAIEVTADTPDDDIVARGDRLARYLAARVRVLDAAGAACPATPTGLDILHSGDRRASVRLVARCPAPIDTLVIAYDLFFDLDPRHVGMLQVTAGERSVTDELSASHRRFTWALAGPPPESLGILHFIAKGIEHIFTGYDHVAFVIGLLLVAAIRRERSGWARRGLGPGVRYVVSVVSAFTLAHSVTLILAALDVLAIPSRVVETAIAVSILYVAVENISLGDPRRRWLLALGFGLVHGLGFASSLRPLLPPGDLIGPLLAFNVGVELGQLAIVASVFPLLDVVARRGADRYRRVVVLGGSAAIAGLAGVLIIDRALGLGLFP